MATIVSRVESAALDRAGFLAQLATAPERLLMLDYDGTLAPFVVDRRRAFPYDAVPALLTKIMSIARTRVLLISGRDAFEVAGLLRMEPRPEICGTYGLQRLWPDGRYVRGYVSEECQHAIAEAAAWLEQEGLENLVEPKIGGIAVHWRGFSPAEIKKIQAKAYRALGMLASEARMNLMEFDGGLELRAPGPGKSDAVAGLLSNMPAGVAVAYLGDDHSDEEVFRILKGIGLGVLVKPQYRATHADLWLKPPRELIQFLRDWLRACGGKG